MPPAAETEWLNSPPQTATDLRGKVVVVQFWTFTCINWRRTLPYMRAWDAKYRDQGLIVIGVHTPEFDFEENVQNVRSELAEMHIEYPVTIDKRLGKDARIVVQISRFGDIPKEALNNRLKWAESLKPHL